MRRALWILLLASGCTAPESVGELSQAVGEPMNGFPTPEERLGIMAINRARSDPATVKGPNSQIFPARPPVTWSYNFSRSSRFHAINMMSAKVTLMHDSPCPLDPLVGTNGCTGTVNCACKMPVGNACANCANVAPINNGCGTPTFTRIGYFATGATGEVAAAGYQTTMATVDGWVDEAAGADGHRRNLLDVGITSNTMGFGHAGAGCWSTFDVSDSGFVNGQVMPIVPTAAVSPVRGNAGASYRVYATWADSQNGNPKSLNVVVDGVCRAMVRELGTATLNSTWLNDVTLQAGCHSYWILGFTAGGARITYPTTGALTVSVGGVACNPDYLAQAPAANCDMAPPDMAGADLVVPADLAKGADLAGGAKDLAGPADLAKPADLSGMIQDLAKPADLAMGGGGDLAKGGGGDLSMGGKVDLAGTMSGADLAGMGGGGDMAGKSKDLAGLNGDGGGGGGDGGTGTTKGGCGCRVGGRPATPPWGALLAVGLIGLARRRRRQGLR
jgi:MYXO-CTERM domain-containing protein